MSGRLCLELSPVGSIYGVQNGGPFCDNLRGSGMGTHKIESRWLGFPHDTRTAVRLVTESMSVSHDRRVQVHADKIRPGQAGRPIPRNHVYRGCCELQMKDDDQTGAKRMRFGRAKGCTGKTSCKATGGEPDRRQQAEPKKAVQRAWTKTVGTEDAGKRGKHKGLKQFL